MFAARAVILCQTAIENCYFVLNITFFAGVLKSLQKEHIFNYMSNNIVHNKFCMSYSRVYRDVLKLYNVLSLTVLILSLFTWESDERAWTGSSCEQPHCPIVLLTSAVSLNRAAVHLDLCSEQKVLYILFQSQGP